MRKQITIKYRAIYRGTLPGGGTTDLKSAAMERIDDALLTENAAVTERVVAFVAAGCGVGAALHAAASYVAIEAVDDEQDDEQDGAQKAENAATRAGVFRL